jgi:uncharacterized protein YggT (Ycf19 family)
MSHTLSIILLGLFDLMVFAMLVRATITWMYARWRIAELRTVLELIEGVTDPLFYPVRRLLPQRKRDTNLPMVLGYSLMIGVWVVVLSLVRFA